ncbi:hypothetical protein [Polymorphospora rubra]|uniref:hypothetical protein n=1 Tax=Polymorphospora rubra TaxID=338584 RepID=UPI0033C242B4
MVQPQFTGQHGNEVDDEGVHVPALDDELVDALPDRRGVRAELGVQHRQVESRQEQAGVFPVQQRGAQRGIDEDVAGQRVTMVDLARLAHPGQQPGESIMVGFVEIAPAAVAAEPVRIVEHDPKPEAGCRPPVEPLHTAENGVGLRRTERTPRVPVIVEAPPVEPFQDQQAHTIGVEQPGHPQRRRAGGEQLVDVDLVTPLPGPERIGVEQALDGHPPFRQRPGGQQRLVGAVQHLADLQADSADGRGEISGQGPLDWWLRR